MSEVEQLLALVTRLAKIVAIEDGVPVPGLVLTGVRAEIQALLADLGVQS